MGLASHPGDRKHLGKADFSIPLNMTNRSILRNMVCTTLTDYIGWPPNAKKQMGTVRVNRLDIFDSCVIGNGTFHEGNLGRKQCKNIFSYCPYMNEKAIIEASNYDEIPVEAFYVDTNYEIILTESNHSMSVCSGIAPSSLGT